MSAEKEKNVSSKAALIRISLNMSLCMAEGAQVDLVIDRNDNVVNLCEIKFASGVYQMDKGHSESMRHKRSAFANTTRTRKSVQTTMITTYGLVRNSYSAEITSEVVLDDLFA